MSSQPPKNNRKRPGHDPRGFVIGSAIGANAGVSDWYARRVVGLYEGMSEDTINEVADLFEKAGRYGRLEVNSLSSQARILLNRLSGNFAAAFTSRGKILSVSLVKRSLAANSAGMRESLKDMAQGFSIKPTWISGALKEKLKAAVTENVSLITSIQQRYHAQVTEAVMRAITTGRGIKDLVPELQSIGGVSARRARFIATDQSRKAAGMITGERARKQHVRKLLSELGKVIENGEVSQNDKGRFEIRHGGKIAVIAPDFRDGKRTMLLTAYKPGNDQ